MVVAASGEVTFASPNAVAANRRLGVFKQVVGMNVAELAGGNALASAINSGMPVDRDAIVAARVSAAGRVDRLRFDRKHHLQRGSDKVMVLADVIPVRPVHEVVSFGDVVLAVGVGDVLYHLLRPRLRHAVREEP